MFREVRSRMHEFQAPKFCNNRDGQRPGKTSCQTVDQRKAIRLAEKAWRVVVCGIMPDVINVTESLYARVLEYSSLLLKQQLFHHIQSFIKSLFEPGGEDSIDQRRRVRIDGTLCRGTTPEIRAVPCRVCRGETVVTRQAVENLQHPS